MQTRVRTILITQACGIAQGMLKGADLSAAYASADIFMMPSETETLGFVALEAMASGLPVVAVAAGGLTDIITQPGVTSKSLVTLIATEIISDTDLRPCSDRC